jgi:cytochrome bd-type quinol oxidase subunit 2
LSGVSLIGVGALISVASHTTTSTNSITQFFGVISAAVGSVLLVIGIGYLAMSYGLLKGRGWAWTITIILMFIGIAIQIISTTSGTVLNASLLSNSSSNANTVVSGIIGGIIGIAINVAIVYYLYRPNVKAYFGKAHPEIK